MRSILATSHQFRAFLKSVSTITPNEPICLGNNVFGPQTIILAPYNFKANILERATLEWRISPAITMFLQPTSPNFSLMEKESNRAWVGCSWAPSPALTMDAFTCLDKKRPAPGLGWRITTISTFMDRILFTVSIKVSPFFTEDCAAEKLMTSADSRFSASSNDNRVRVLFSKKIFAIVISRSEGTFLIDRLITSLKWSAVSKISWISDSLRYFIPNK